MEWISVKDRLPENEQEVLVISHGWGGRLVYVGTYKKIESETSWLIWRVKVKIGARKVKFEEDAA